MKQALALEFELLLIALQFLTRLPISAEISYTDQKVSDSAAYYPLVGIGVGGVGGLSFLLLNGLLPAYVAVWLTVAVLVWLTGCFHEDGFADMCDGVGGGVDKAAALHIMRDSRLGTYGVAGLILLLGTKVATLSAFAPLAVPLVLVAGHSLSRLSAVMVIMTSDYVRATGIATRVASGISRRRATLMALTGLFVILATILSQGFGVCLGMLAGCIAGHVVARWQFERKLGGYTGDCLGATQQLSELGLYLGALVCI